MPVVTAFVSPKGLRVWLSLWIASAFGIFVFAGANGLGASRLVSGVIAAVAVICSGWLFERRSSIQFDNHSPTSIMVVLFAVTAVLSLIQLARLCVFTVNPAGVGYALSPNRGVGLSTRHLCMTAYFVASQSISTYPNIYDEYKLYSLPVSDPNAPRKPRTIGQFDIDAFEYPPPFLLLPRTLAIVAPQFLNFRMLWFGLYGSIVLLGLLAVASMYDPVVTTRILLLSPLILGSDIVVGTMQIGNIQAAVIALSMLSMVLFAWGRHAAGGMLLAFAIVSKLFPGMLLVYLAVRREWRPVLWTAGGCVLFVCLSIVDTGSSPYGAFLHQMPRLLSGEAFPVFRRPGGIATNLSVPGLFFKLKLFGLPGGSFETMKIVGTVYTLIVIAITVVIGRRRLALNDQPLLWLAILILASLRSPFLPPYGLCPLLWLLIVFAATRAPTVRAIALMLAAWIPLNIALPVNSAEPRIIAGMALISQAVIVALILLVFSRTTDSLAVT